MEERRMTNTHDTDPTLDEEPEIDDRYASLSLDDQVVIYDAEDDDRWIQSNLSIDLSEKV